MPAYQLHTISSIETLPLLWAFVKNEIDGHEMAVYSNKITENNAEKLLKEIQKKIKIKRIRIAWRGT